MPEDDEVLSPGAQLVLSATIGLVLLMWGAMFIERGHYGWGGALWLVQLCRYLKR